MNTNINEQIKNAQRKKQVLLNIREEALAEQESELADNIELRLLELDKHIEQLTHKSKLSDTPYIEKLKAYRGSTQLEDTIAKLIIRQAQQDETDADKLFWNAFGYGINTGIFNSLMYANDFKQFFISNIYEMLDEYNLLHKHDNQYNQLDIENIVCEVVRAIMQRIAVIIGIIRLD